MLLIRHEEKSSIHLPEGRLLSSSLHLLPPVLLALAGWASLAGAGLLLPPPIDPYLDVTGLEEATGAGLEGAVVI